MSDNAVQAQTASNRQPLISINGWRRITQFSIMALLLILPFMGWIRLDTTNLGGHFDITLIKLSFFGKSIWLNDFFIVNLVFLWFIALFTFFSVVLGRVFCGWVCPQTLCSELVTDGSKGNIFLKFLISLGISLYISANTLLYFAKFDYLKSGFMEPSKHPVVFWSFWIITAIGLVDMFVYRHTFCNGFCPYGWLQSIFQGEDAIVVRFETDRESDCINCEQCVKTCYMGIDIRKGPLQMECQKCGKCIDACRMVLQKKNVKKLIRFAVETPYGKVGKLFSFRSSSLTAVFLILTGVIAFVVAGKKPFHLVVTRNSSYTSNIKSDKLINSYKLEIDSYGNKDRSLVLSLSGIAGVKLLKKNNIVKIKAGKRKILRVFVAAPTKTLVDGVNPLHFTIMDIADHKMIVTRENSFVYEKTRHDK